MMATIFRNYAIERISRPVATGFWTFEFLDFGFVSDFGFRISDLTPLSGFSS
jgi:hypothetical protein